MKSLASAAKPDDGKITAPLIWVGALSALFLLGGWFPAFKFFGYVTVACGTGLSISCLYVQQKQSLEACDESA